MKWLHFILSHSIFVSICAFALSIQSFQLLHVKTDLPVCLFIFFATLASYNFYWMVSKFRFNDKNGFADFMRKQSTGLLIFLLSSVFAGLCLFYRPQILPVATVAVALTLLYSVPLWPVKLPPFIQRLGFFKTVLLAFTWAYVTIVLPMQNGIFVSNLSEGLLFTARFLFMLMLALIFDSRDVKMDKIRSMNSLATIVSKKTLSWIMGIVFCFYMATGLLLRIYLHETAQVIAFIITGVVTLLVYRLSLKDQGYFFYYFIVDGLMLFSSAATFMASI